MFIFVLIRLTSCASKQHNISPTLSTPGLYFLEKSTGSHVHIHNWIKLHPASCMFYKSLGLVKNTSNDTLLMREYFVARCDRIIQRERETLSSTFKEERDTIFNIWRRETLPSTFREERDTFLNIWRRERHFPQHLEKRATLSSTFGEESDTFL